VTARDALPTDVARAGAAPVGDRRPAVRSWLLAGAFAAALGVAAGVLHHTTGLFWGDLATYRAGAVAAAGGDGQLYQAVHRTPDGIALGFTYPPFAALLMQPLAVVAMPVAVAGWTAASVVVLVAIIRLTLRWIGPPARQGLMWTAGGLVGALPIFAVTGHLQVGQVGLLLTWLVLVDLVAGRGGRWHGLGIGVAAGIKLTPLIFIGYLVLTGRLRAAATATVAFAATIGVGFAWRPTDSNWFWTGGLLDTDRVTGDPRTILNQSLSGAVTRVLDEPRPGLPWLVVAVLVGAAGMTVAVRCARAGDELLAVLACAATGLLVSPVSWHHHWVWWVPALLVLVGDQRWYGRRSTILTAAAGWLVLVGSTSWVLASPGGWDLHFSGLGLIYSNLYVLLALGGLGLLGWRVRPGRAGPGRRAAAAVGPADGGTRR